MANKSKNEWLTYKYIHESTLYIRAEWLDMIEDLCMGATGKKYKDMYNLSSFYFKKRINDICKKLENYRKIKGITVSCKYLSGHVGTTTLREDRDDYLKVIKELRKDNE